METELLAEQVIKANPKKVLDLCCCRSFRINCNTCPVYFDCLSIFCICCFIRNQKNRTKACDDSSDKGTAWNHSGKCVLFNSFRWLLSQKWSDYSKSRFFIRMVCLYWANIFNFVSGIYEWSSQWNAYGDADFHRLCKSMYRYVGTLHIHYGRFTDNQSMFRSIHFAFLVFCDCIYKYFPI